MWVMAATPKQLLRKERRAVRRRLAVRRDLAADATALADHLLPLLDDLGIGPGDDVAAYVHLPGEPQTSAVCRVLADRDARVVVPITLASHDLDWYDLADPKQTPLGLDAVARCRLLLVPGLCCDRSGNRLGQAGGCYDRTLPRARPEALTVVLLHPGEVLDEPLPIDPWDAPVRAALTADGLIWFDR